MTLDVLGSSGNGEVEEDNEGRNNVEKERGNEGEEQQEEEKGD